LRDIGELPVQSFYIEAGVPRKGGDSDYARIFKSPKDGSERGGKPDNTNSGRYRGCPAALAREIEGPGRIAVNLCGEVRWTQRTASDLDSNGLDRLEGTAAKRVAAAPQGPLMRRVGPKHETETTF